MSGVDWEGEEGSRGGAHHSGATGCPERGGRGGWARGAIGGGEAHDAHPVYTALRSSNLCTFRIRGIMFRIHSAIQYEDPSPHLCDLCRPSPTACDRIHLSVDRGLPFCEIGGDAEEGQPQVLDELRARRKGTLHRRVKAGATEEGREREGGGQQQGGGAPRQSRYHREGAEKDAASSKGEGRGAMADLNDPKPCPPEHREHRQRQVGQQVPHAAHLAGVLVHLHLGSEGRGGEGRGGGSEGAGLSSGKDSPSPTPPPPPPPPPPPTPPL